jgi:hypothetical protein
VYVFKQEMALMTIKHDCWAAQPPAFARRKIISKFCKLVEAYDGTKVKTGIMAMHYQSDSIFDFFKREADQVSDTAWAQDFIKRVVITPMPPRPPNVLEFLEIMTQSTVPIHNGNGDDDDDDDDDGDDAEMHEGIDEDGDGDGVDDDGGAAEMHQGVDDDGDGDGDGDDDDDDANTDPDPEHAILRACDHAEDVRTPGSMNSLKSQEADKAAFADDTEEEYLDYVHGKSLWILLHGLTYTTPASKEGQQMNKRYGRNANGQLPAEVATSSQETDQEEMKGRVKEVLAPLIDAAKAVSTLFPQQTRQSPEERLQEALADENGSGALLHVCTHCGTWEIAEGVVLTCCASGAFCSANCQAQHERREAELHASSFDRLD